jgi:hypothetical protein
VTQRSAQSIKARLVATLALFVSKAHLDCLPLTILLALID